MKKYKLFWIFILSIFTLLPALPASAGVNDFYFSDFTGDYYLSRDGGGISHLKVVEQATAVFPDFNQNKGICRQIPFTNQAGKNITLPRLTRDDIIVLRNGVVEPIYSITKENGYFDVCTGTDEYVLGEQVYTFKYSYEKVVTEFDNHQELYWDTNGNGAPQRFDKVVARLHFDDDVQKYFTGQSWCYVGKYGESGSDRCTIAKLDDGVEFTAQKLAPYENLSFDVELKPGTFVVPEPDLDYTYVWILVGLSVVCLLVILFNLRKFVQTRDKARYYKGLFVKPEYQPHAQYSLPEMAEVYFGKKKDVKVAMLLELVTKRKVSFQKKDNKKWNIVVNDLNGVEKEYLDLLAILNGGNVPMDGAIIELKNRSANSKLIKLRKSMESAILNDLKNDSLVEEKYSLGSTNRGGAYNNVSSFLATVFTFIVFGLFVMSILDDLLNLSESYGRVFVFEKYFFLVAFVIIVITSVICMFLSGDAKKYYKITKNGLMASRYMDGLKLYIEMAEADRMKLLQSVSGVDTSAEGIVNLYEKLLPYAAVFGLEESWMKEMKQYCEVQEIEEPDYLMQGIAANEIVRGLSRAASIASTSTTMSSSGGGSSSGFSGGGGGGFSGGGGGGGGFGGR